MRDRRNFLLSSAALVAAASLPKTLFAERRGGEVFTNASLAPYAQGLFNPHTFENLVGDTFTMFVENNGVAYLRLERVVDFNLQSSTLTPASHRPSAEYDPGASTVPAYANSPIKLVRFSLSFTTAGDPFDSGNYLVDHGRLGRFALNVLKGATGRCSSTFCLYAPATTPIVLPHL